MKAFHNDPAIKAKYFTRVEAHRVADEIVQGTGFEKNGKIRACAVGCTLDVYDHSRYPIELGLPLWLAYLEDSIHEGVPLERAKRWPGEFLAAIPVGADLEPVQWLLTAKRMERLLPPLALNKNAYARACKKAILDVATIARDFAKNGFSESAWNAASAAENAASAARSAAWSAARSAAWSAAWSAARSAESAESAESAASAARSAARSAAESAAWSAESAESAARSVARSAARSAASAAWSAESAARSAARSAAWEWEADTLMSLLRECK